MAETSSEKTVLLVDSDGEARETIAEHLMLHGFAVQEATNGVEAWRQLERARPHAVVLNLNTPRLGGLEALRWIRSFDRSITLIALAEEADTEVHWRALELGAREILPTPVVLADLLESLEIGERLPPEPAGQKPGAKPSARAPAQGARVLVVTDDVDARATLGEFLRLRGYQGIAVSDDAAAMHAVIEATPTIVLLDVSTVGLGGIEAVSTIFALAPDALLFMMGQVTDAEIGRRGLARGVFDFIAKPVDLDYLGESLDAALTMRRLTT